MVEIDFSIANEIYDNNLKDNRIYSSHMEVGVKQTIKIHLSTAEEKPDQHKNSKHNLSFKCFAKYILTNNKLYENKNLYVYFPQIAFFKMFQRSSIDIRKYMREDRIIQITLIRLTTKRYKLIDLK